MIHILSYVLIGQYSWVMQDSIIEIIKAYQLIGLWENWMECMISIIQGNYSNWWLRYLNWWSREKFSIWLGAIMLQAISSTDVDEGFWCHTRSLDLNESRHRGLISMVAHGRQHIILHFLLKREVLSVWFSFHKLNSLNPGGCVCYFKGVMIKLISWIDDLSTCEIAVKWIKKSTDDKSTLG